jgi:3-hydroxybutyryl-CoA dehydrogenase
MKLVEVVSGAVTGERAADCVYQLARSWGKVAVHARNSPGFIVNRVARSFYAEPLRLLQEKAASVETIDRVFRESGSFRMGPFELMDLIGNDVNYAVTESVFNAFDQNSRFLPSALQKERVDAGTLGQKSGRGWYDYSNNNSSQAMKKPLTDSHVRPQSMVIQGDIGVAGDLAARASEAGISVTGQAGNGSIRIDGVNLMLTDGRTAALHSEQRGPEIALFDLVSDFATTGQVALAFPAHCGQPVKDTTIGFFNSLEINVSIVADSPGLCLMRTVCMLANEAADAVHQGVCDVEAVDTAMMYGVNYPVGPLQWADRIGLAHVQGVLNNIRAEYGEERYRCSPLIQSRVESHRNFY